MPNLIVGASSGYDLALTRRASFQLTFNLFTDATYSTAYDLTDCEIFAEIRKKDGGVVYLDLMPTITGDGTDGEVEIDTFINPVVKAGTYKWDMLLVDADGVRVYIATGAVRVAESITDENGTYDPSDTGVDLQTRLNNNHTKGAITLPMRETEISTTLITQNRSGGVVKGHGSFIPVSTALASSQPSSRSSIVAKAAMTDILRIRGVRQHWSDFNLLGDAYNSATGEFDKYGTTPDIGLNIYWDSGFGSGKHIFDNVTIQGCTTGINFGKVTDESNCDESTFRDIRIQNCDVSVRQYNIHSLANWFQNLDCFFAHLPAPSNGVPGVTEMLPGSGIAILIQGGGKFRADRVFTASPCTLFKLDPSASGTIGSNNALYEINTVHIDTGSGGGAKLYDVATGALTLNLVTKTIFRNVFVSYDHYADVEARLATLRGGSHLVIEHGYNIQKGMFNWFGDASEAATTTRHLELCNCKFSVDATSGVTTALDLLATEFSTNTIRLTLRNCTDVYGRPFFADPTDQAYYTTTALGTFEE